MATEIRKCEGCGGRYQYGGYLSSPDYCFGCVAAHAISALGVPAANEENMTDVQREELNSDEIS